MGRPGTPTFVATNDERGIGRARRFRRACRSAAGSIDRPPAIQVRPAVNLFEARLSGHLAPAARRLRNRATPRGSSRPPGLYMLAAAALVSPRAPLIGVERAGVYVSGAQPAPEPSLLSLLARPRAYQRNSAKRPPS